MDDRFAERLFRLAEQGRQQAYTILARAIRQFCSDNLGTGCCEIGQASELLAFGTRLHVPRPANEKGDMVPAFIDVRLRAAEDVAGIVALGQ
jgi:hypothetical protein